jgi:hypothetical protein
MAKSPQLNTMASGEVRNCRVSFASKLDVGETVSGSSVVTISIVQGTTLLVVSTVGVSTGALTVNGSSNSAGQVVTFIASSTSPDRYEVLVSAQTSLGQTINTICPLLVEASS